MHTYTRIEHRPNGELQNPTVLYEGRFDIAEHDVVYAAHAFMSAYAADVNPADVIMRVWALPMDADPEPTPDYAEVIYTFSGNLLIVHDDMNEPDCNPYLDFVKLLKMGALTEFSSVDQVMDDGQIKTFFWYAIPGWSGPTTGGDTKEFCLRMNALEEGWDAAQAVAKNKEN